MALNPVNVVLGQLPQPLGASHAVSRPLDPNKDDALPAGSTEDEDKQAMLSGPVIPDRSRWVLGGFLKR
jgi:hypothetical protein